MSISKFLGSVIYFFIEILTKNHYKSGDNNTILET